MGSRAEKNGRSMPISLLLRRHRGRGKSGGFIVVGFGLGGGKKGRERERERERFQREGIHGKMRRWAFVSRWWWWRRCFCCWDDVMTPPIARSSAMESSPALLGIKYSVPTSSCHLAVTEVSTRAY